MKNNTNVIQDKLLPSKEERHRLFGSVKPGPKTKPTDKEKMSDLQNLQKDFLFDIDSVGISNVKHPIIVNSKIEPRIQTTIATFQLASSIGKQSKGTNMSRFTELLNQYYQNGFQVDLETLRNFTKELADKLGTDDATIHIQFPWFYERKGPQSELAGMNHADISIRVSYLKEHGFEITGSLSALITTLCPCSKEISEYSAHNQRGNVTMEVTFSDDINEAELDWKEALLEAAESNASARIHPVLKRPDEKIVTEQAYENPRFVEDIVRLVAADLYEYAFVKKFKVTCRNEESIHMHDAIASLSYDKEA